MGSCWRNWLIGLFCAACAQVALAQDLPEPLTLAFALSLADDAHPDLERAAAALDRAVAGKAQVLARTDLEARLRGEVIWVDPNDHADDPDHNDNRASLLIEKPLYDFGYTGALQAAAEAALQAEQLAFTYALGQRRLAILHDYLDVLLADVQFQVWNEAMAIAFVRLDRAQDRGELGQVSDIELIESEAEYQHARAERVAGAARQRSSRARLAATLNRPQQLSSTLAMPDSALWLGELGQVDELIGQALAANPQIALLEHRVLAAEQRLRAARNQDGPSLSAALEAHEYQRHTRSRDNVRGGLVLDVPLYRGGRRSAEVAAARADVRAAQADLNAAKLRLHTRVQELWNRIGVLQVRVDEARAELDFRELYLDRSRALYEMEVRTDLGDAMVRWSEAKVVDIQVRNQLILAWAELDLMLGRMPGAGNLLETEQG